MLSVLGIIWTWWFFGRQPHLDEISLVYFLPHTEQQEPQTIAASTEMSPWKPRGEASTFQRLFHAAVQVPAAPAAPRAGAVRGRRGPRGTTTPSSPRGAGGSRPAGRLLLRAQGFPRAPRALNHSVVVGKEIPVLHGARSSLLCIMPPYWEGFPLNFLCYFLTQLPQCFVFYPGHWKEGSKGFI